MECLNLNHSEMALTFSLESVLRMRPFAFVHFVCISDFAPALEVTPMHVLMRFAGHVVEVAFRNHYNAYDMKENNVIF